MVIKRAERAEWRRKHLALANAYRDVKVTNKRLCISAPLFQEPETESVQLNNASLLQDELLKRSAAPDAQVAPLSAKVAAIGAGSMPECGSVREKELDDRELQLEPPGIEPGTF